MHTWEITQHIKNLKGLVKALRATAEDGNSEDEFSKGYDRGLINSAKQLESEIMHLENNLKERGKNVV